MKPFGDIEAVKGDKPHGHDECHICSGQPRGKTSTRMRVKRDIRKAVEQFLKSGI
jgi:hypothetical protein